MKIHPAILTGVVSLSVMAIAALFGNVALLGALRSDVQHVSSLLQADHEMIAGHINSAGHPVALDRTDTLRQRIDKLETQLKP